MRIPIWKKWLSYFFELPVEQVSSEHNSFLQVSIKDGHYQLSTERAIYSNDEAYTHFGHAFSKISLPDSKADVLLLGFGLGSIPLILERQYSSKYHYTAVEIDHAVIELASKYTVPRLASRVEFIEADAAIFIQMCQQKFPMICMDVFHSDVIPEELQSIEFLEQLNRCLTHDGILLYNCLAYTDEDKKQVEKLLEEKFYKIFPSASYLPYAGNWVLINDEKLLTK